MLPHFDTYFCRKIAKTIMLKKTFSFLFSTRLMALLFVVFAVAMGVGTFIENDYGTPTARIWIYNAWWFESVMFLFLVNFIGNIKRYQLLQPKKWLTLILHLAFILILVGAFVTRYISYEGIMPIREGETTSKFLSEKTYLQVYLDGNLKNEAGELQRRVLKKKLEVAEKTANHFVIQTDYNKQPVTIEYIDFISGAEEGLVPTDDGKLYLKMVESGDGTRHDHFLEEGVVTNIHNILYAFNKPTPGAINISYDENNNYTISSPFEGSYMRMADQEKGTVLKDSVQVLQRRSLYSMAGTQFVFPDPVVKGRYDIIPSPIKEKGQEDALIVKVTTQDQSKVFKLLGGKGVANDFIQYKVANLDISMRFGSEELKLPFALRLNDFIAEKYPGTETGYSSYKSKVSVIENNQSVDHDIYMNHVLDHGGYRFFQASFDPDEKGTILSVSHDFWGTWISYIGYFLLYVGLMGILLVKGSRFKDLEEMLSKIKAKKAALSIVSLVAMLFFSKPAEAQSLLPEENHASTRPSRKQLDSIILANAVDKKHANEFGRLVIQDESGRMKPVNTFASELLRKLSKSDQYKGLNPNQVMLSMLQNPTLWFDVPLIYVDKKNDSIRKILGTPKGEKRVSLTDLFNPDLSYKLEPYLEAATITNTPSNFEKDFIKTHEKFYLLNSTLMGDVMRIFPIPNDENNKWIAVSQLKEAHYKGIDSLFTHQIIPLYRNALLNAKQTGDYKQAQTFLDGIKKFQENYGSQVMPTKERIDTEIMYNKYDIFRKLFSYYMYAGVFLLLFVIIGIFYQNKFIKALIWSGKISVFLLFIAHTAGLIARWYISGHAPWSDAYESIIYVAWATQFFGLAFGRKSDLTVGATAFVSAVILMVAHWNWLDPAIGNLQPVLNSYWLMIHVAVIVASYGPFMLGAILGALSLLLMLFTTKKNKEKMLLNIKELTVINEMSLTVGLVMLTIGNFLGGQWANESWGRYWGWDPKETWALISIMVYAFVIHMRLVPGMRGRWLFNFASLMSIASIMMTYFGVNFYLSGLHSYASGDQVITPDFVWYSVAIACALGVVSLWKYRKYYKK